MKVEVIDNLKEHIMIIHMDTITLLCNHCEYNIKMSGHMKHHTRIHRVGKHIDVNNVNMKVKVTMI